MKLIQIRIEDKEKKQVEAILKEMGLNITTATLMFYKKILQTRSIPFSITAPTTTNQPMTIPATDEANEFEDEEEEETPMETMEIESNLGENPIDKVKKPYFRKIKIN